jgi:hypothetical protein
MEHLSVFRRLREQQLRTLSCSGYSEIKGPAETIFQVLMALIMKMAVVWVVAPCRLMEIN